MKTLLSGFTVLALICFIASCVKKEACNERTAEGKIIDVQRSDRGDAGEQMLLTLKVENPDSLCVQEVSAYIEAFSNDSFMIRADLVHSGDKKDNDCPCNNEPYLYTGVYFSSEVSGKYWFSYHSRPWNMGSWLDDTSFSIDIE